MPTEQQYLVELEHVCFGALPERAGSAHLLNCPSAPVAADEDDWYSCVLTVARWQGYVSTRTWHDLARQAEVPLPFLPMGSIDDVAMYRILNKVRTGAFAPKLDFSLGFPLVWITPKAEFDRRRQGAAKPADVARDYLGLVHRAADEHLVAIHLPASAIQQVNAARPTFADAGHHRRFMVSADDTPPVYPAHWGQTLDLECFEDSGRRSSGAAERVCARIEAKHLVGGTLPFEYLGRLERTRGEMRATDKDFAKCQIARDPDRFAQVVDRAVG